MNDGPFPEHDDPIKLPIGTNPLHPQVASCPAARIFASDRNNMGNAETLPYVATTYSITKLFRHWTMMLAFFLVHIYMAFWVKGSITGMIEGRVSRRWAKKHHPRWYREVEAQEDKQRQ